MPQKLQDLGAISRRAALPLLLGLALGACDSSSWSGGSAQTETWANYEPPNRGAPGETSDLGSRPLCKKAANPFTAISPSTNWGETIAPRPTFWLYLPYQASSVRLILRDEPTQEEIYRTTFTVSAGDGVARFQLPETAPPLEIDRLYNWQFDFICDAENRSRFRVSGLVVRRAVPEDLQAQLNRATPQERVALLAERGFWYDTLTALADLRLVGPNLSLDEGWRSLLGHSAIGLEDLTEKPLLACCDEQSTP